MTLAQDNAQKAIHKRNEIQHLLNVANANKRRERQTVGCSFGWSCFYLDARAVRYQRSSGRVSGGGAAHDKGNGVLFPKPQTPGVTPLVGHRAPTPQVLPCLPACVLPLSSEPPASSDRNSLVGLSRCFRRRVLVSTVRRRHNRHLLRRTLHAWRASAADR